MPTICKAIPHISEAIAAISLPKCVASSGTPEKIRHGLTCAGLYDRLAPHIFSASQVKRGKPAPDLFLFAAGQMQAAPARCLVIEDSLAGIAAAVAAGMTVLGFHGGSHCRPGSRRPAARRRGRRDIRRYAAVAGVNRADWGKLALRHSGAQQPDDAHPGMTGITLDFPAL